MKKSERARSARWAGSLGLAASLLGCPSDPLDLPRRLEAEGAWDEAGDAYLAAAKADPAHLAAWEGAVRIFCREQRNVGRCLAVLDYELDLLGRVDAHADALAEALEDRGRARLERGLVEAARSDLERAQAVAPHRASVHAALARVHLARGRLTEAKARLRRARELRPDLPELESLWPLVQVKSTSTTAPVEPTRDPRGPRLPAFGR